MRPRWIRTLKYLRAFGSSSATIFEEHRFEGWKGLSRTTDNENAFSSQATDIDHPLIQGISKLLQSKHPPGKPGHAAGDARKLSSKKNSPSLLSLQRKRKLKRLQVMEMQPTQYLYLMTQWIKKGSVKIGQPMFEQMLKVGVEPVDAYTTMIRHFVGRAQVASTSEDCEAETREEEAEKAVLEALQYLHDMRDKRIAPNANTYEPLVLWFLQSGKTAEFEELLEWIKEDDLIALAGIFGSFGTLGRHDDAYKYFTMVETMGISSRYKTEYLFSYVRGIVSNCKCEEAVKLFRHACHKFQLKPAYELYDLLIKVACKEGQIHLAMDFIQEMDRAGIQLTSSLFHPLLLLFVDGLQPQAAFESFRAMQRMGVQPSLETYNFLIRACVKANDLEKIFSLLGEMKQLGIMRTTETYNAIIQALGTVKQYTRALAVFREMQTDDVKPDSGTYIELILASQDVETALELLKEMQANGIRATDLVYGHVVNILVKNGATNRAIQILEEAESCGKRVGIAAKSALLSGLSVEHRLEEALTIFEDIKIEGKLPDPYAHGHLIEALGYAGQLDRMMELFNMYTNGGSPKLTSTIKEQKIKWCLYVTKACVRHNDLQRLHSFLKKAKEILGDDSVIFDCILLEISDPGEDGRGVVDWSWDDGFSLLNAMHKLDILPSRTFLEVLLDGCAVLKDAKRGEIIVEEMEKCGLALNSFTLIRLLRVYVSAKEAEKAAAVLVRLQKSLKDEDMFFLAGEIMNDSPPNLRDKIFNILRL